MTKIIIELRDFDLDKNKVDNSEAIERITNCANKFWNCESVGIED